MLKKNLILVIVIFLILGVVLGYFWGLSQVISKKPQEGFITTLERLKMIHGWSARASGEVSKISGRILTLISNGESLEVPIIEEARIIIPIPVSPEEMEKPPEPKEIRFEDIKIGDKVDVFVDITDNELRGINVVILPK